MTPTRRRRTLVAFVVLVTVALTLVDALVPHDGVDPTASAAATAPTSPVLVTPTPSAAPPPPTPPATPPPAPPPPTA
ncbi:MAG: hypothetical protein KKA97_06870, partial [Actinobacteria bacterium]|nr:hypothetical protein [Actinomycetota bacterium]